MKTILLIAALLTACSSSSDPFTWADASLDIASIYCTGLAVCQPEVDAAACTADVFEVSCPGGDDGCSAELDESAATAAIDACRDAVFAVDCATLEAGELPAGCDAALGLEP
jgi:hypothetical protein